MMKTVVLVAFLAISCALCEQRDLVDEAEKQLQQLEEIVQGQITVAHNKLDSLVLDLKTYEMNVVDASSVTLQQQQQTVNAQLAIIKNLAQSTGKDISSCTDIREEVLGRLPDELLTVMNNCIGEVDGKAVAAARDARYLIDVYINKVHDLGYQLRQCHGELLCISPILNIIELDKVRIPQYIGVELQATESLLDTMRLSVKSCADTMVGEYSIEAYAILGEIEDCVNDILGFKIDAFRLRKRY